MAKWNYVKIGDVCTVERGGSPRPIDKFITDDTNGINWIKIGDATDSMYITEAAQKIIPEGMKKSRYVQPGDFLLSNSMSFGRPYILKIDGCIHDGWLVLRDNGGVFDKRFLYYYLSSPSTYQKFKNMAVGGVVNNLNSDMVRGVTVPIPKMEEQIEIVQTLDNVSNLIFLRKQQLAKLDELVKARFVEMFGDPVVNPKGFPCYTVGEVIDFQGGSQPDKKYFEYELSPDNIRLIQIRDYKSDKYITYIPKTMAKRFCTADDIMIGRYGPPIFQILKGIEGSFNVALMKATPKVGNREFVRQFLKQDCLLEYLEGLSKRTAGQDGIQMDKLKAYPFPYPPIDLQEQFAAFVTQTDKSKVAVQKALDEAQLLFDSLMQKYFG